MQGLEILFKDKGYKEKKKEQRMLHLGWFYYQAP